MKTADDWKLHYTYLTAIIIAVGGIVSVVVMMFLRIITADVGIPIIASAIGSAIGFLFGAELALRAVKDYDKAMRTTPPGRDDDAAT